MHGTLVHLSDLHLGRGPAEAVALRHMVSAILAARVDQVVVTGDVTDHGRLDELATFRRLTAPIADRLTVVPGNHDRLGEDAGRRLMSGRVAVERRPGLHLVRLDSTAPHNRRLLDSHGLVTAADLDAVEAALSGAGPRDLVAVLLHHHVHPLPGDDLWERLAGLVGLPWTAELCAGAALLSRLRGRCDLVLHGHRHVPAERLLDPGAARPLRVANAGCTPALGRARLFVHADGRLTGEGWLTAGAARPAVTPVQAAAADLGADVAAAA
ncbi:MAG: metallophosphoesterase [Anaeromyxobacter sp.]|nr:metallophosphoesterase [Anaeromyxobacter sp.]MBL0275162.1 metallophosphoesterase [Anaeromyxobacter sp.]